jgi:hypothetical protein
LWLFVLRVDHAEVNAAAIIEPVAVDVIDFLSIGGIHEEPMHCDAMVVANATIDVHVGVPLALIFACIPRKVTNEGEILLVYQGILVLGERDC